VLRIFECGLLYTAGARYHTSVKMCSNFTVSEKRVTLSRMLLQCLSQMAAGKDRSQW